MQFAGTLVDNAQVRTTNSGKQVTGFTVALNENYKAQDGSKVQKTTYIDCAYWNRPNLAQYLIKGMSVQITGFPTAKAYQAKSGEYRGAIDFRVDRLDFLGESKTNASEATDNTDTVVSTTVPDLVPSISDDDLPF